MTLRILVYKPNTLTVFGKKKKKCTQNVMSSLVKNFDQHVTRLQTVEYQCIYIFGVV
jgi:hypothetical protein